MSRAVTSPRFWQETEHDSKTLFGFWVYLMTDCVLFASLFATYAVLQGNTYGGPGARELFNLNFVLIETAILLVSSFTSGLALLAAKYRNMRLTLIMMGVTIALGVAFLAMELSEFHHLVASGNSWQRSGFLSAFFTLVGTHGLHILSGLLWAAVLVWQIVKLGLNHNIVRRMALFGLFWHFLDIVWIFIFTMVYLMGAI